MAADRCGSRVVRAIVLKSFRSRITKHQTPVLQSRCRGIAVQDFSMLRNDALERDDAAILCCNAIKGAADVMLCDASAAKFHGRGVHLIADGGSTFQFGNLLLALL